MNRREFVTLSSARHWQRSLVEQSPREEEEVVAEEVAEAEVAEAEVAAEVAAEAVAPAAVQTLEATAPDSETGSAAGRVTTAREIPQPWVRWGWIHRPRRSGPPSGSAPTMARARYKGRVRIMDTAESPSRRRPSRIAPSVPRRPAGRRRIGDLQIRPCASRQSLRGSGLRDVSIARYNPDASVGSALGAGVAAFAWSSLYWIE